jgi:hypothetical protein
VYHSGGCANARDTRQKSADGVQASGGGREAISEKAKIKNHKYKIPTMKAQFRNFLSHLSIAILNLVHLLCPHFKYHKNEPIRYFLFLLLQQPDHDHNHIDNLPV